jgi:predicted RNA binding protein YcfA (HicA-like mRNA interferase family)
MKVRDMIKELREGGARVVSTSGSHQKWGLPDGNHVVVTVNHMNSEVSIGLVKKMEKAMEKAGMKRAG